MRGTDAAAFAEVMRQFLALQVGTLDGRLGPSGIPSLGQAMDGTTTAPCNVSGTATVTISGNGADRTVKETACIMAGDVQADGGYSVHFRNVDTAHGTYDYTFSFDDFSLTTGGNTVDYRGTASIHTSVTGSVHTHRVTLNQAISEANGPHSLSAQLTATVSHPSGDYSSPALSDAAGTLDISDHGTADVDYLDTSGEIRLSGAQGTEAFVKLDGSTYALRYADAQGATLEVAMDEKHADELDVLDGANDAPVVTDLPSPSTRAGQPLDLDLSRAAFDPDLEPVSLTLALASAPAGSQLDIQPLGKGVFRLQTADGGDFSLTLRATDAAGAWAKGQLTLTVHIDTDGDGLDNSVDPDDDNDGVPDTADAFPLDPTEWLDTDGDGIGNNADTDDDNDGVPDASDAYPLDPACWRAADGADGACYLSTFSSFDRAWSDGAGSVYFVADAAKTVLAWDAGLDGLRGVWNVGTAVPSDSQLTASVYVPAHQRLYLGYDNGGITYVDTATGAEHAFATLPASVGGLGDAGNFLLAQDASGSWNTHYIFAADGTKTASADWNYRSRVYTFNPAEARVYFFRDGISPNDVQYEHIDQTTGAILDAGETPYHGSYAIQPPLLVSPSGDRVLIGSGNLFRTPDLTWAGAVPGGIAAGYWDSGDGLIALRDAGGETALERRDAASQVVERLTLPGAPRAIAKTPSGYLVVTTADGQTRLRSYQPSDDTDGDGVVNTADAFPNDPAASVDTDGDGYPDAWNAGKTEADSTTGLVLDAYPDDSACYLLSQGAGGVCDVASTLPAYMPDSVAADADGNVYLLSAADRRIFRYSASSMTDLSPIPIAADTSGGTPTVMEYSPAHHRLYLGYPSGAVTYVDPTETYPRERPFTTVAQSVGGIGAAGDYVLVQDFSGAWATHYIFDRDGVLRDSADWNYYSTDYEWDPALSRIFFFRDDTSPNGVLYEDIAADGTIASNGAAPYNGDYQIAAPIVMSPDGNYVLIGSGDIYRSDDLTYDGSLLNGFKAAIWDPNGSIVTAREVGGLTRIDRYDASRTWVSEKDWSGTPLALVPYADGYLLVTYDGLRPVFSAVSRLGPAAAP